MDSPQTSRTAAGGYELYCPTTNNVLAWWGCRRSALHAFKAEVEANPELPLGLLALNGDGVAAELVAAHEGTGAR